MMIQIGTHKNEYTKEWDNESLAEHSLTHFCSDAERKSIGRIDYHSPSRALIVAESLDDDFAIWRDAEDCARKLNFFLIAREASTGIHRANSCAGLLIASAINHHCHGESLSTIGKRIGKAKQVICRYNDRFISWSSENSEHLLNAVSPEYVIGICNDTSSQGKTVADLLDELRCELTDVFFDLLEEAERLGQQEIEIYSDLSHINRTSNHPIDIAGLLAAF